MHPPVKIIEEGRITVTYLIESEQGKEEERVFYKASFLVCFSDSEKDHQYLTIETDKTFTYAWSFSLNHGPKISGCDRPEWVMTILRTFNQAGVHDDAESRVLRLLECKIRPGKYCYEVMPLPGGSPISVTQNRLFSPVKAVRGPTFFSGVDVIPDEGDTISCYTF